MEKSRKKWMSGTCCGLAIALNEDPDFGKRLKMQPLKPRSAERVGYFTDKIQSDKAFVEEYFRLRADPEIDVVPVTQNQLDEGIGERLDRIVRP